MTKTTTYRKHSRRFKNLLQMILSADCLVRSSFGYEPLAIRPNFGNIRHVVLADRIGIMLLSVCLSVCLSVTLCMWLNDRPTSYQQKSEQVNRKCLRFTSTPILFPQTSHILIRGRWCYLANKLKHTVNKRKS